MPNNHKTTDQSADFEPYQPNSIPLFEALYGKHLISLGGHAAIDNMFSDLNIRGLKALDLGFGLGGVAFYLAEKYQMKIAGIEIHPWMVQFAKEHAPKNISHLLEFDTYHADGKLPYQPSTFDLVYSKGVLNHVADKSSLFQQIHSVLKSNGLFVIADWIFPTANTESAAALVSETKESYEKILIDSGFNQITFRDDSQLFLGYAQELLNNLSHHQELITQKFGKALWLTIQQQHEALIENINNKQKIATRIVANKSS